MYIPTKKAFNSKVFSPNEFDPPPKSHRLPGTGLRLWAFCRVVRYLRGPHRLSALVGFGGLWLGWWGGETLGTLVKNASFPDLFGTFRNHPPKPNCAVLYVMSKMSETWPFSVVNNKQLSRMVEVEHQPALDFEAVFLFSKRGDCQVLMCFFFPGVYLMDPYGILGAWFNGTWDVKLQ